MSQAIPSHVKLVVNPYESAASAHRLGVMITGPWHREISDYILHNNIEALYLNSSLGWVGTDYGFLGDLVSLKELNIISGKCDNLSAIERLSKLEELSLVCAPHSPVNFSCFPRLARCSLTWWNGAKSIFECAPLNHLYLDGLRREDCSGFASLKGLVELTLANSTIASLKGLSSLRNMTRLELLNCRKLQDAGDISGLSNLVWLRISGSKRLSDIKFISGLHSLEVFVYSDNGEIDSLMPLASLNGLKALSLAGSTIVRDGDLGVLADLRNLGMLTFASRKHYNYKATRSWNWEDFNRPGVLMRPTNVILHAETAKNRGRIT